MECCMSEYLQKDLEEKYQELCHLKDELVSHFGEYSEYQWKRSFLEMCDEIEELIREQRTREMRGSVIRKARG